MRSLLLLAAAALPLTPGAQTAAPLDSFEGAWRAQIKTWSAPGGKPAESTVHVERRHAQGLLQTFATDTNQRDALPFHAVHYNTRAGRFESVFSSPASPGLVLLSGQADGAGKTIILTGSVEAPDGGRARWKEVLSVVNETTTKAEFLNTPPGGSEWLAVEITFTRTDRRDDPLRGPGPGSPRPIGTPPQPMPRPPG